MRPRIASLLVFVLLALPFSANASHDEEQGSIAGIVTDGAGAPLSNICVTASADIWWTQEVTDQDGRYGMTLPVADYLVRFDDCARSPRRYLGEWFDDAQQVSAATLVTVSKDAIAEASAALAIGGAVTGIVTTEDGDPIEGVCVSAEHDGDWSNTLTADDGTYTIGGFATSAVLVQFGCDAPIHGQPIYDDPDGFESPMVASERSKDYVPEWYSDRATREDADAVAVIVGATTPAIDAALTFGGAITGVIETLDGDRLSEMCASAYDPSGEHVRSTQSLWSGTYRIGGLTSGEYRVEFSDCSSGSYAGEWFDDASGFTTATPVQVTLGAEHPGVHAALARRPIADLAIRAIEVHPVPVRTDLATLPGPGTRRTVEVAVGNIGGAHAWGASLYVWVEIDGRVQTIGQAWLQGVAPHDDRTFTFDWDALGSVGDARVEACLNPYGEDARMHNNEASVQHYAVVGGLGFGKTVRMSYDSAYCW